MEPEPASSSSSSQTLDPPTGGSSVSSDLPWQWYQLVKDYDRLDYFKDWIYFVILLLYS